MADMRVGLIGCGHISTTHLQAWKKAPGATVRGVLDMNQDLARERASQFGIERVYETAEELIAECDAVDVCTPPQSHAALAEQVLGAGRHLLIEKPLVTDIADWERLGRTARESDGKLVVVHNLKQTHAIQTAKQWVESGRIGRILRLERKFLTDPASDRMLVGNEHWSHRLPGGRWHETLPHALYLVHYFLGPLAVDHVAAVRTPDAPAGAPAGEVLIAFRGADSIATVQYSAHCATNTRTVTLIGSEGTIEIDTLSDVALVSSRRDKKWKRAVGFPFMSAADTLGRMLPNRGAYLVRRVRKETPHFEIIRAAAEHFLGQRDSPTPLDEIDYVVRNCDAIGRRIDEQL